MTATQALKSELHRVQHMQAQCLDKYSIVISSRRYEYNLLIGEAKKIRDSIEYMEGLAAGKADKLGIEAQK